MRGRPELSQQRRREFDGLVHEICVRAAACAMRQAHGARAKREYRRVLEKALAGGDPIVAARAELAAARRSAE